ncbi:phage tail protein [Sandarakinorhabdus sp. DWP1-3-1]|uniref:phage tail protein n=1 Tax=Sandarakinorhabdus sp. DWP1-3-1 TaxID=2804627 RepID=UPI003CFA98E5
MATLVLGTVGRIFGGPLGGLIGTFVGGAVDRAVFGGGGKAREVGRIGNLAIQSAAYGEPIPFIAGRMRSAGNLVWTSGVAETATRSGGGKRGPSTTNYSYSASFAVALAGREIVGVERIWADGKLIRDAAGVFTTPIIMRLHCGSEGQDVDPLIAAAEGAGGTPAYRGTAYAVFEDLPLGDYGNRIPNLTFEIVADAAGGSVAATAITALGTVDGRPRVGVSGELPDIAGFHAGRSGSSADALAPLVEMASATLAAGQAMEVRGAGGGVTEIPAADCDSSGALGTSARERRRRLGGEGLVGAVEVAFYDTSRDYQIGLQRSRRDVAGRLEQQSFAAAMAPQEAKALAARLLTANRAARVRATVRLPWRHLGLGAGDLVRIDDDATVWRVRELRFEQFVMALDLERVEALTQPVRAVDGGRVLVFDDGASGPTELQLLDLPGLPGEVPVLPRLWVAAAGVAPGWRRAGIEASGDDGASYAAIGVVEGGVPMGVAIGALTPGPAQRWDRFSSVDVRLLSERDWLEPRSQLSVLAGSNLALIGDEIIQFSEVEPLPDRVFRLSGLLRGRRGTEAAIGGHTAGERFVLLDAAALLPFDPPLEAIGRRYAVRPIGAGDGETPPTSGGAAGRALLPLAPVHLRLVAAGDAVHATWIRRSRAGFGWSDCVDAPLGEAIEAYAVAVSLDGRPVRDIVTGVPTYTYGAADRIADGGGAVVTIAVRQLSSSVGPGPAATATIL